MIGLEGNGQKKLTNERPFRKLSKEMQQMATLEEMATEETQGKE